MKKDPFGKLFLVALLVVAGGLVAVTRMPNSRWVETVAKAPVVGPWIDRLARLYRQPEAAAETWDLEGGVEVVYRIDTRLHEARPTIQIPDGKLLYPEASESLDALALLPETSVELFDRRDDWYLVEYEGQRGWVRLHVGRATSSREPPLGSQPAPPLPVPSRQPDPEVLARALELLGDSRETKSLAAYTLYTDVHDRGLLIFLSAIAAQLESVYESRYGLVPLPGSLEAVVLFGSKRDFSRFFADEEKWVELSAPGIVRSGVVATYYEGQGWNEVAATLVHELTHLLNKRALGPALPPWLDEGIADDMAQSRIEGLRIFPGTLGGSAVRSSPSRTDYKGAQASILELARSSSRAGLPGLETLLGLDSDGFQDPGRRSQHYGQASFFVRLMLDSPVSGRATAFRSFLLDVSEGGPVTPDALLSKLDRSWASLDAELAAFVERQAEEAGLPF